MDNCQEGTPATCTSRSGHEPSSAIATLSSDPSFITQKIHHQTTGLSTSAIGLLNTSTSHVLNPTFTANNTRAQRTHHNVQPVRPNPSTLPKLKHKKKHPTNPTTQFRPQQQRTRRPLQHLQPQRLALKKQVQARAAIALALRWELQRARGERIPWRIEFISFVWRWRKWRWNWGYGSEGWRHEVRDAEFSGPV